LTDPKLKKLRSIIEPLESVVVAYSGGVDSTLLLRLCRDFLGERVLAVTATAPFHPQSEAREARKTARALGVKHLTIDVSEVMDERFMSNPPDRCYICKKALLTRLTQIAREGGFRHVVEGANADDTGDFRPGMKAVRELKVRSPLMEAGLGKADVRRLSKRLGLKTWNKAATPCLATRFPYNQPISPEAFRTVEKAENYLHRLGFQTVRVRHHGNLARIEVSPSDIRRISSPDLRKRIARRLKQIGYTFVALDLEGYRVGSMNEPLRRKAPPRCEAES